MSAGALSIQRLEGSRCAPGTMGSQWGFRGVQTDKVRILGLKLATEGGLEALGGEVETHSGRKVNTRHRRLAGCKTHET